ALLGVLCAAPAWADTTWPTHNLHRQSSIASTGAKHVRALAVAPSGMATLRQGAGAPARRRSFVKRRPVISGMLIGMAAGTAVAGATAGREAAFVMTCLSCDAEAGTPPGRHRRPSATSRAAPGPG